MINLIQILNSKIITHLVNNSVDQNVAVTIARDIVSDLVHSFGGQMFYLPNNSAARTAEKHQKILAECNGSNHREIYQKYKIGSAWLSKLLKRAAQNGTID
ncbi:MAG: Mor transcription activator family protein [Methylobacter sp.]